MTQFRETEVKALANTLKENQKQFDDERHSLKLKMGVIEEKHSLRVQELHDELRKTQESHQEYLTRLMEVLEATLSMREQETAKISAELHAIKAEKDSQILMLEQEVRALRARKGGLQTLKSAVNSRSVREYNRLENDYRTRRSAQFDNIAQSLQSLVAESNALPCEVEDHDLAQVAAQQDRAQNMSEMVDSLHHLFKTEEVAQAKTSQTNIALMEEFVTVSEPQQAIRKLRNQLARMEIEAERLRDELLEKEHCKKCAVREAAARRRLHG
jgi:hypothetical protein